MEKIVLVEDEAIIAMSICDKLEEKGFSVVGVAKNYNEGLKLVQDRDPDLVLLDINIQGDKNGIELGREIQNNFKIPFIYLTSNSDNATIKSAKKTLPINYLFKDSYEDEQFSLTIELAIKNNNENKKSVDNQNHKINKLNKVLNQNSNLILRIDDRGEVLYVNSLSNRYFGKNSEEVCEKSSLSDEIHTMFKEIYSTVKIKKRKIHKENIFPTMMGERHVKISSSPEFDEDNKVVSVVVEIQDITDQKIAALDMLRKHKKISESIDYSKNIQDVLFPELNAFDKYFSDSFVFNKPKDTIGGDFPFIIKIKDDIYIALVDCTGHGVPGALMSLIIYFLLSNILNTDSNMPPGKILDILHFSVIKKLKQHFKSSQLRDGADIALLKINNKKEEITFASAHRPLFVLDPSGELSEIKGDRHSVGGGIIKNNNRQRFSNHSINFEKGTRLFVFSDGITDQFNEVEDLKYGYESLRDIFKNSVGNKMYTISEDIEQDLIYWQGTTRQIDDMLAIGVEV